MISAKIIKEMQGPSFEEYIARVEIEYSNFITRNEEAN